MKEISKNSAWKNTAARIAVAALLCVLVAGCSGKKEDAEPWLKDYAGELVDQGLYSQAARAYENSLLSPGIDNKKKANIYYMLGDLYREKISDYDQAMASYMKVKYLDPDTKLKREIDQKIIECLEKSGRSADAQRKLDSSVSAKPKKGGPVVARVGGREITMSELDEILERQGGAPAGMSRDRKKDFLKSHIASELMAGAAVRKGYDREKKMIEKFDDMKKAALAQRIFQEEISSRVKVDQEKARLYYEANKEEFKGEDGKIKSFEEASRDIYSKLYMEEQQKVAQEYITRLLSAEKVEIFDENIAGSESSSDPYDAGGQTNN